MRAPRSTSSTAGRPGRDVCTIYTYPFHVLDVVGWDGCLYPYVFNVSDFEPITGRIHQRRRRTRSSRAGIL